MKATMDMNGCITLEPETSVEAYAMQHWVAQNLVQQLDVVRAENCHWRGSGLVVRHSALPEPGTITMVPA